MIESAVDEFRRQPVHVWPATILLCAGRTYLSTGHVDDAASRAREALSLSRSLGARASEAEALWLAGEVASRAHSDGAEAYYEDALSLADGLGLRPLVAHCHLGLGTLLQRTAAIQRARQHLDTARAMYRDMDLRHWLQDAAREG